MEYYAGLDVSLKEIFISILDKEGNVVKEGPVKNDPASIDKFLEIYRGNYGKIGLESGQFSIYLCKAMKHLGYEVICVDARHMAAGLSALGKLDKELIRLGRNSSQCKRLMTVPGIGVVTAMTYISTVGDATRFKESENVGAYLGLTPKQYASGDVNRQGGISRMGPSKCRSMLYESAHVLLSRSKKKCRIKEWGLKLAKKKGKKKAIVAVARKLSVIMHRMLADKTEFCLHAA